MRVAFIILIALGLYACDSREDYFEALNGAPQIKIYFGSVEQDSSFIGDSIKMGFPKNYGVTLSDEEEVEMKIDVPEGISIVGDETKTINAFTLGVKSIRFFAYDGFGRKGERTLTLTSFDNLNPVPNFTVNVLANREIEVVASGSYDRDSKFGGLIVSYEYTFNGNIQTSSLSVVRYRFGTAGQKRIELRVKDNSGQWSNKIEVYVTIS